MWEKRHKYKVLVGNVKETGHVGRVDVDGKIILKWILRNCP
jgi:hypothetical protein